MSDTCLFCGGDEASPLTNEHINPRWLLSYLGLPEDDLMLQGIASSENGYLIDRPRVHSSFSFVHGHVCAACNGGWMRRLEAATKPILVPLMESQRSVASLSEQEESVVRKWSAKTAYLHSWAGPMKEPVQIDHLKHLCGDGGQAAPGVGVFAMQAEYSKQSSYVQTGHWPQFTPNEKPNGVETPPGAYKIALQYRRLYLLVAFWPSSTSVLTRLKGMHRRLSASEEPDREYDFDPPAMAGPLATLKTFADWLAVVHVE
jgi:hypothetical protein